MRAARGALRPVFRGVQTAAYPRWMSAAAAPQSVREIRKVLEAAGVATRDCLEKADLVRRYEMARDAGMLDRDNSSCENDGDCDTCPKQRECHSTSSQGADESQTLTFANPGTEPLGLVFHPADPVILVVHRGEPGEKGGLARFVSHRILSVGGQPVQTSEEAMALLRPPGEHRLVFSRDPAPLHGFEVLVQGAGKFTRSEWEAQAHANADIVRTMRTLLEPAGSKSGASKSVREMKAELEAVGVATADLLDKSQLLERYARAKERGMFDPKPEDPLDAKLRGMSVSQLSAELLANGVSTRGCLDKDDLIRTYKQAEESNILAYRDPSRWINGFPPPLKGEIVEEQWMEPASGGGCGGGGCGGRGGCH
eukprot:TRINITY_DN6843_c2_g1_i1.p1 TRINITY_DN6843_c2_g1~~TRINITY_DN6843_c2_g1_i1.p1  ORF type:complete len:368 (+),score=85.77 TRINITY_DN6843_c2_g1_i1:71-1174(+)